MSPFLSGRVGACAGRLSAYLLHDISPDGRRREVSRAAVRKGFLKSASPDSLKLLQNPFPDQLDLSHSLFSREPIHGCDFRGLKMEDHGDLRLAHEDGLSHFLQLVLEVGKVMGIPEPRELLDRIRLG